jgi:hypothetical protein
MSGGRSNIDRRWNLMIMSAVEVLVADTSDVLSERITALVTQEELAAADILSKASRRKLSAYIRELIIADMQKARKDKRLTDDMIKDQVRAWKKEEPYHKSKKEASR